jgi:CHAT domain-containing protein/Tfp pilus assembly protein PilF
MNTWIRTGFPQTHRRIGRLFLGLLLVIVVGISCSRIPSALGEPSAAAKALTPAQEARLKERDRLKAEAQQLRTAGKLAEAVTAMERTLAIEREVLGDTHDDVLATLEELVRLDDARDDLAAARKVLRELLALRTQRFGETDWRTVDSRWALTDLEQRARMDPASRAQLRQASALEAQVGHLYDTGQLTEALRVGQQVLAIYERLFPPKTFPAGHPDFATSLNDAGLVLMKQKQYAHAQSKFERAVTMYERLYPPESYPAGHPDLATTFDFLGKVYQEQGQYRVAQRYYEKALSMRKRLYPPDKYAAGQPDLAVSLSRLGYVHLGQGDYAHSRTYFEQALAMRKKLYPKAKYTRGHPELAAAMNNVGAVLQYEGDYDGALQLYQEALAMQQLLLPKDKYPLGHPDLARNLNNLGFLLQKQGNYARAQAYYQQALAMRETLYPKDKYPQGHLDLVSSLNNLGLVLEEQGDYQRALSYEQRALAMYEALYPQDKYPLGHPDFARGLNNMGSLLQSQGEYDRAMSFYRRALAMYVALYPKEKYPQGHPDVAQTLNNLGTALLRREEYQPALPYLKQALAMYEALYPKEKYLPGHPDVAVALNNLGFLCQAQGDYRQARSYYLRALAMNQQLYPRESYPVGHPRLAKSLYNLGVLFQAQEEYPPARDYFQRALAMYQDLLDVFAARSSEAEAMNLVLSLPLARDNYLSVTRHLSNEGQSNYELVWRSKAALLRLFQRRQQALSHAADPDSRHAWQDLVATRRELSRLALAPGKDPKAQRDHLDELTKRKEQLERQLALKLPDSRRQKTLERAPHTDLLKRLPPHTVFIDLLRYVRFEQDPKVPGKTGERRTPGYLAFVLHKGQSVQRVELGPAAPIEAALAAWRRAITAGDAGSAAVGLRSLLWERLAKRLPAESDTVLLSPDGALTALPWAALPMDAAGSVLLERYAVALVPHGPFLLDQLTAPPRPNRESGLLLAVGGVSYNHEAQPTQRDPVERLLARLPERGETIGGRWPDLPGTTQELDTVLRLAGSRSVIARRGFEASSAQLLVDLPKARWAHLATHGFFADPQFRSALQIDEKAFERGRRGERIAPGARNPLVLSGLVLAGANLPVQDLQHGDSGILTAEAIAGLPLQDLELVVLSACKTGLGEVAGGEGVFGLQRAFHMAGAHNVLASLWKVNDEATAALMALFYHHLWKNNTPPILALREAQLHLYRHPEQVRTLAHSRGPIFDTVVPLPKESAKPEPAAQPLAKADVKLWAGFVLSGPGR